MPESLWLELFVDIIKPEVEDSREDGEEWMDEKLHE